MRKHKHKESHRWGQSSVSTSLRISGVIKGWNYPGRTLIECLQGALHPGFGLMAPRGASDYRSVVLSHQVQDDLLHCSLARLHGSPPGTWDWLPRTSQLLQARLLPSCQRSRVCRMLGGQGCLSYSRRMVEYAGKL